MTTGPQFEIVIVGLSFEDDSHYTTERLESFYFEDEKMARRAYLMAKKLIEHCKEDISK